MNWPRVSKNLLPAGLVVLLFFAGVTQPRLESAESSLQLQSCEYELEHEYELEEEEELENRPDQPDEALRFRRLQLQDERGQIPHDGLEKARQHVKLMKQAQKERTRKRIAPYAAGIEPDSWTWLGPGNIGGRIRSIVISPTNANNMWIGSVSGGIWRTTNGGASWQPVNDFLANLAVSTMVINPANPNIMYAGTGEGVYVNLDPNTAIQGIGIFQSTDGGLNWNQLPCTDPNIVVCPNAANFLFVNRLAISPNGNTILAATNNGIMRSTDSGATWGQRTFTRTFDIDFHPTNSTQAIAGGEGGSQFSTDGGLNWNNANFNPVINPQPIPPPPPATPPTIWPRRVELAYAPSSPTTVYALVNQHQGTCPGPTCGNYQGEVYRSANGGQTFTLAHRGTNFFTGTGNQGWYDNIIWVNPQDQTFVIVGGIHLWRSTDSGASYTQISDGGITSVHPDHHIIVAHPNFNNTTNRTVFFGNDGGIYRTDNIATVPQPPPLFSGWIELNNNLGITQFYGAAGNASSGVIIGGAQDNGTARFTGNQEGWTFMSGGDGGYCASDPTDPNFFYGETQNLSVLRSTNGGVSADAINAGLGDANQNPPRANFIAPLALDPNEPNTLLAGGLSLWRTNNVKATGPPDFFPIWASIKAPTAGNTPISAIVVSPGNSAFICVGDNNGNIFLTFNGTAASPIWAQINTAALPGRFVTRLVIDSTRSPSWIYATFGGFNNNNVFRSTDLGSTWVNVSGAGVTGLPAVPVRALAIHPHNANLLYAGTELGIFVSEDAGAHWEPTQDGPANVSVDELFWMGADLIAVTHGRGLYRASGGVYVDCNYNGIQIGTFNQPFKTVASAITTTNSYRAIWIKPCNYNETFIMPPINKRLELRALGGPVIIGRP